MRRERRRVVQQATLRDEARVPGLRIADTTPRSFFKSFSTMTSSETSQMSERRSFVAVQVFAVNGQAVDQEKEANTS